MICLFLWEQGRARPEPHSLSLQAEKGSGGAVSDREEREPQGAGPAAAGGAPLPPAFSLPAQPGLPGPGGPGQCGRGWQWAAADVRA